MASDAQGGHEIHVLDIDGSPMETFLFRPEGAGPHPAILLAMHIPVGHTGIENDDSTLEIAARYARNGFVVAVPFIFHWWPKSADIAIKREEFRDDWTAKDLAAAFDFLAGLDAVDSDRIGVVGHCWGGRVAWLAAALDPRLKACVVFYGGRVKLAMGPETPPAIDLAGRIACPVAGFFGQQDQNPSPADVDDYEAALAAAGVPREFHRYEDAGHGFQTFNMPERYREAASEDAWAKAVAFLRRTL